MHNVSAVAWILLLVALGAAAYLILNVGILLAEYMFPAMGFLTEMPNEYYTFLTSSSINATWYPPNSTHINNLNAVINGTGVYGFIFNNSYAPADNSYYGGYNWCNMPHVNKEKYSQPSTEYALEYVEVVSFLEIARFQFNLPCYKPNMLIIADPQTPQTNALRCEHLS